ncbi:MAG: Gfo/Idh/MocA family oxidoreductase [Streptosporangiaceae bacterium]
MIGSPRQPPVPGQPPIRIGVIGATPGRGWGTAAHLPALRALGEFQVTAVSTTRLDTARATAEAFGVPLAFANDAELVSSPEVEAVAVTVKVPDHDQLIRAALAAGKHVFSEWPLGVDLGQAAALAELAQASGVRHIVGLQGYQAPGALYVRELIENGAIGQPLTVSVVSAGGPAGRRIPQANVYATDVKAGATVLSISGGHILATLARAVGEFRQVSGVVALVSKETTVIETGQVVPVTAPDQVVLAGRLQGGAAASVAVQGGSAGTPGFELRVVGTEATLVVRPATPGGIHITDWAISVSKPDGSVADRPVPARFSQIPEAVPAGPPRNVAVLYREFARAIRGGQPAVPDFATAVRFHRLLENIQRASDTGVRQEAVG